MKNVTKNIPPMMKIPIRTGITTIAISVGVIPVSFSAIFYYGKKSFSVNLCIFVVMIKQTFDLK